MAGISGSPSSSSSAAVIVSASISDDILPR
jgi:hypothetical protein